MDCFYDIKELKKIRQQIFESFALSLVNFVVASFFTTKDSKDNTKILSQ